MKLGAEPISREFRVLPLRHPVDVQFAPYYKRILNRDLSAITDYVDRNAPRKDLDPSFYELVGRLVTIRFYAAADLILSNIEARGNIGYPTGKQVDAYWSKRLLPFAENAKEWIRGYLKNLAGKWNRTRAWATYAKEMCKDDWERAEEAARNGLPDAYLASTCDLERHRVISHSGQEPLWRERYMILGLVPREIFLLLAEQRGTTTRPSWAVRKYLRQWDSNIKARLKSVREKTD